MPYEIVGRERISRLLFQSGHFSRQKNVVKAAAFSPPPDGRLSVAHTEGLSEAEILDVAKFVLAEMRLKNPSIRYYGRADFFASEVSNTLSETSGLETMEIKITRDDEGFARHTTIRGWPEDETICDLAALTIASKSKAELLPKPIEG
jgi:hypothetical protein